MYIPFIETLAPQQNIIFRCYYCFIRINFPVHRGYVCLYFISYLSCSVRYPAHCFCRFIFRSLLDSMVFLFVYIFISVCVCFIHITLALNERNNQLCMFLRAFFSSSVIQCKFIFRFYVLHFHLLLTFAFVTTTFSGRT